MIANSFDVPPSGDTRRVLFGLACVVAIAWIYLLTGAGIRMERMDMGGGNMMLMPPMWSPGYAVLVFAMWAVMMAAMMLPSAVPAILHAVSLAQGRPDGMGGIPTALFFTAGYLMVWTGFSVGATFLQWALDAAGLLSETMAIRGEVIVALLVLAVGLFQSTRLKQTFLRRCHSPVSGLAEDQRPRMWATVRRGMRYGGSCLGCCAVPMGLLFVGGVMNDLWIAVIALWLLAEKTLSWGSRIARLMAAGLVAWGSISLAIALS